MNRLLFCMECAGRGCLCRGNSKQQGNQHHQQTQTYVHCHGDQSPFQISPGGDWLCGHVHCVEHYAHNPEEKAQHTQGGFWFVLLYGLLIVVDTVWLLKSTGLQRCTTNRTESGMVGTLVAAVLTINHINLHLF